MFKSHEEFRRQKELDEARKAGVAPAAVDEETGKDINPHIPQYMTNAPWYLNIDKPTLKHQRDWREKQEDSKKWYDRGAKTFQATKWRKGACEKYAVLSHHRLCAHPHHSCGAITHATKDCVERPRAKGAKFTNKHIAADEKVESIDLESFDAKRDRWNGYDAEAYSTVMDRYERLEAMREANRKKAELESRFEGTGEGEGVKQVDEAKEVDEEQFGDDEDKIGDEQEAGFAKVEKRVRTNAGGATGTVRNLRIREDTAKYLLNLDVNSAHYDPKTRSMREDPTPWKAPGEKTFAGENFVRQSGDYQAWRALNLQSITTYEASGAAHSVAAPSAAAILFQQQQARKMAVASKTKTAVLDHYGNAAEPTPDDVAALAQSEAYVEYDKSGRVVKGQEVKAVSRYPENVLVNNHTCVWGSWWHDGMWGYACCHQVVKNSYCTGKAGEAAAAATQQQMVANLQARQQEADARAAAEDAEEEEGRRTLTGGAPNRDVWGEAAAEQELDEDKLKEAIKKQRLQAMGQDGDERKRKYNSLGGEGEVTAEDMEAYRLTKQRTEDPMLAFKKKDDDSGGYDYV